MGALLHHIAERAGELKLARAIEHGRFDLEQLAADGGPRKSVDHADLIGIPELLFLELRVTKQSLKIALFDAYPLLALSYTLGGFAADRGYELFEPSDARLAGVAVNHISYRAVRKAELTRREPVLLELLGDKMLLGDMELAVLDRLAVSFKCGCSKERFARGIASIKKSDIQEMIDAGENIETCCQFCNSKYVFTPDELKEMM